MIWVLVNSKIWSVSRPGVVTPDRNHDSPLPVAPHPTVLLDQEIPCPNVNNVKVPDIVRKDIAPYLVKCTVQSLDSVQDTRLFPVLRQYLDLYRFR